MRNDAAKMTASSLEQAALWYLERYASSAANLRRVLLRRLRRAQPDDAAELAAEIDKLIARLIASRVLDDRSYAEAKAASLHRQGASRHKIRLTLAAKGVPNDAVAAVLAETGDDLTAACRYARRRRLGPFRAVAKQEAHYAKDLAALARAGFAWDMAEKVMRCQAPDEVERLMAEGDETASMG